VPELKIEFTAKEVVFKVKDDGIGIPNEEKDRVFNLFFRGSNTQGIYGTGIGLGIVKKISDTLGGTIEVRSKQNAGTEFIVTLPII
jgi:signal transduction histidine kinase